MLSKEEIEKAKGWLSALDINSEFEAISKEILLQYIKQLEQENSKLNKIIYPMAETLVGSIIWDNEKDELRFLGDTEEVKQYFEKKVGKD